MTISGKYGFDDDCIEEVSEPFCEGFEAARQIVLEILKSEISR